MSAAGGAPAGDLAEVSARFGAALREAGLPVGPGRCERFAAAVTVARPQSLNALYLCALATLVSSREHGHILRAVFDQVFGDLAGAAPAGGVPDHAGLPGQPPRPHDDLLADVAKAAQAARTHAGGTESALRADSAEDQADAADREVEHRYLGTSAERLASKDFAELSDAELASVATLMRRLTLAVPERVSRRQRRRPGGRRTDMRTTLRQARRTGGHAFRLIGRTPARRPRRLVVLCDISGSMEPYARALLQLMYVASRSSGGAGSAGPLRDASRPRTEVFAFATRLTRLTQALAAATPETMLAKAGEAAPDWAGGTRIGAALREFNDRYGVRGMARGAVILIISDGWETGDPALLGAQMARLHRIAYRIVWANPRTQSSRYRPEVGGMAAAWPYCDAVVSAHNFEALDELLAALRSPAARRPTAVPAAAVDRKSVV